MAERYLNPKRRRFLRQNGVSWIGIMWIVSFHVALVRAKFMKNNYRAGNTAGVVALNIEDIITIKCGSRYECKVYTVRAQIG